MWDMLATLLSSQKAGRVAGRGSIETIFWLIDCSLVTGRQMELPNLTTLLLLTLTALMQCTVTHKVAVLSHEFYNLTQHSLELYRLPFRL